MPEKKLEKGIEMTEVGERSRRRKEKSNVKEEEGKGGI